MGAAIGIWVALTLAVPASLRPINLNLQRPPHARPPASQAPKTLPPAFFTTPIPKPPPAPAWLRAMFVDPDNPPPNYSRSGHGGVRGFGRGFGGGHGRAGGCHGGGHR